MIFDLITYSLVLTGVIEDNHNYHVKSWASFCKNQSIPFCELSFKTKYLRKSNQNILPDVTNSKLSQNAIDDLAEEQIVIYRNIYRDYIKPVSGLRL